MTPSACFSTAERRRLLSLIQKVEKLQRQLLVTPGRIQADGRKCLRLTAEHLNKHIFIAGGSGMGKSKLIEVLCRQLIEQGEGFTFIDPHGDTAKLLLQFCAVSGVDPVRVVYLRPGIDHCFSLDPLHDVPVGATVLELQAYVESTADTLTDAFLRNSPQADQDVQKRLKHRLKNLLWVVAIPVDGKHLGLSELMALTNPGTLQRVLAKVGPALRAIRPEVYDELEQVVIAKSETLRNQWIESTTNLLSGVLGVYTELIFGQHAASLAPKEMIRERKIVLVDLGREPSAGKSKGLSRSQGNVIGGMLLNLLIAAARDTAEEERTEHYLIVDEAENYVGEDLRMAFPEMRKYRLPVVIAFQNLASLKKGELDMTQHVIQNCGVSILFQQSENDNIEYLGKTIKYASLDMTPSIVDTTLPDGHEWVDTETFSIGVNAGTSESTSESATETRSASRTRQTSNSIQESVALALSKSESENESTSTANGRSETNMSAVNWQDGKGISQGEAQSWSHGRVQGQAEGHNESSIRNASEGRSIHDRDITYKRRGAALGRASGDSSTRSSSQSDNEGESRDKNVSATHSEGGSASNSKSASSSTGNSKGSSQGRGLTLTGSTAKGATAGEASGVIEGLSLGKTLGLTKNEGTTLGKTFSKTPLPKYRFLKNPTGSTVVSVADQFFAVMKQLADLPQRFVLMKVKGVAAPFLLEIHDVQDAYRAAGQPDRSKAWRDHDIAEFLQKVYAAPYYFVPTDEAHRSRIDRFLADRARPEEKNPENGNFPMA